MKLDEFYEGHLQRWLDYANDPSKQELIRVRILTVLDTDPTLIERNYTWAEILALWSFV